MQQMNRSTILFIDYMTNRIQISKPASSPLDPTKGEWESAGRRNRNRSNNNDKKSGAEKAEYQLFLDVRQFMQQIQGFVNGLQRDEKEQESVVKTRFTTNNLLCWNNFDNFVEQFESNQVKLSLNLVPLP